MRRRLLLSHRGRDRYMELDAGRSILIGRSLDAGFFLNDPSISRRHCTLHSTGAGVEVEDHGSRNACLVNGRRVVNRTLLGDGSVLQIGALAFAITLLGEPELASCESCGAEVKRHELQGSTDGRAVCPACVTVRTKADDDRLAHTLDAQGFEVVEELPGFPPTFRVRRKGAIGKTFLVKALQAAPGDPRVAQLREQARALATLDHEAITSVFDVLESEGFVVIVLADAGGEPLATRVAREGPLALGAALEVASACAGAVDHAAAHGVVHRDLTPANVILLPDGRARLTGFALLRDLEQASHSFSGAGELDRLLYLAPELLQDANAADARADVFGIGAVLLHALLARCPWGRDVKPVPHVRCLVLGDVPAPDLSGVPAPVLPLLGRLLDPDPARRPTPRATRDELLALACGGSIR